jgi:hypothetical protein
MFRRAERDTPNFQTEVQLTREEMTVAPMQTQTTVLPGHRIEISTPDFPEGTCVDVLIVPATTRPHERRSALEIIQSLQGHRLFQTPDEVRRHLQEEREAWDR